MVRIVSSFLSFGTKSNIPSTILGIYETNENVTQCDANETPSVALQGLLKKYSGLYCNDSRIGFSAEIVLLAGVVYDQLWKPEDINQNARRVDRMKEDQEIVLPSFVSIKVIIALAMANQLKIHLFGDQTYDVQGRLKYLLRLRENAVVNSFLERSYNAIRNEIHQLTGAVQQELPRFTSVEDLLLWKGSDVRPIVPLDMALTCIYQLGMFMGDHEYNYPSGGSLLLGLCTGTLPAAAISCCRNTMELIPLAVTAVVLAFRVGVLVVQVGNMVEPSPSGLQQQWSMIVAGGSAQNAVRSFSNESKLPSASKPYVSAIAPSAITISGPPSSLISLLASKYFENLKCKSIPIFAPYHAPQLFSWDDIEELIQSSLSVDEGDTRVRIPVLTNTGEITHATNYQSLVKEALGNILLQPINWDTLLEGLQTWALLTSPQSLSIIPYATTASQLVYTALKQTPLAGLLTSPSLGEGNGSVWSLKAESPRQSRSKIAIIGLSGRFPTANSNDAFWELLHQGLDVHKSVPPLHWSKTHVDPSGTAKNTSATPFGCWLDNPEGFDARFFNISPREAPQIDPAQRMALMTAYEAIEQAGVVPDATPSTRRDRVGVYYGVTSNDWMETNSAQNIDTYFIPGGNRAFIPGRINYFFKFSGPSYAVDTACSSSLAAMHIACNALWNGDIDTAIAGGTNILTNPDFTAGLDRGHFLSRTGNCKTFDDSADGYCRGEGVGTVVLKRLEDALADNDPIQGVILGAYTNHSAEAESITRPHTEAQRAIFRKILNQSVVDPSSVSYVEMHGTGTQAGDASEMMSVLDVFAPRNNTRSRPLYLGSAKANIGHGEAASGITSLIKVLLMMKNNTIPPHCGIKTKINHKFPTDLDERNVRIALEPTAWERQTQVARRVFVNNFSAAGGNTALLIEDAPKSAEMDRGVADPRVIHLVAVSAKNGVSLQGNLRSLKEFLGQYRQIPLNQVSYTTTARRIHHPHRAIFSGATVDEIRSQIDNAIANQVGMKRVKTTPKIIFTFTGQGAQFPGMGKQLLESFPRFYADIRRLDHVGQNLGFPSVMSIFRTGEATKVEGDITDFAPVTVQLASVYMQMAMSKLWASWNIYPDSVVGHSLGEYPALNVAGVLSDADTIYLVGKRAELLQQKCSRGTHSMLVVMAGTDAIEAALKGAKYEIACINSPGETVLAGPRDVISMLNTLLSKANIRTTILKVPYAFHSTQVDGILPEFEVIAQHVTFSKPTVPVLCPLDGDIVTDIGRFSPSYLGRHCRGPVNMLAALQSARRDSVVTDQSLVLEVGPHPAVSGMVKSTLGPHMKIFATSRRNMSTWELLPGALKYIYEAGGEVKWAEYHRNFKSCQRVISLPSYSWDLKDYWIQYVNDWSLRKGDPPLVINAASKLESTTIHKVLEETSDGARMYLVIESDITRPDLNPLVQGHLVDEIPLCTPSVYADIALTLGTYLLKRYRPLLAEDKLVDVSKMNISKALIAKPQGPQPLQVKADVDWSSNSAAVTFVTFDNKAQPQKHAECVISFEDKSLRRRLENQARDVKQRMQVLRNGIADGTTSRFNRAMVYRMIRPLAQFHGDYKAIDEVVLDSSTLEALSRVSFGSVKKGGDFHTHPAIIDALTQSCGFAMNCNDNSDLDVEVFMNHGWGSFQLFEPIDFEKEYTTYTQSGMKSKTSQHTPQAKALAAVAPKTIQITPEVPVMQATDPLPATSSKAAQAMNIISEESGVSIEDLTDDSFFTDIGIDSLLALTITARFREELDLDMDHDSMFMEFPTVLQLKKGLGHEDDEAQVVTLPASAASININNPVEPNPIHISIQVDNTVATMVPNFDRVLQIVSDESGISTEDLTDETFFADIGIDSLLSLVIVISPEAYNRHL
ncbi:hypothetical protein CHU98_g3504 [Xylaria longipes]|nr:hypothetical protein CHU98_g3504 [Xylaria longipes]